MRTSIVYRCISFVLASGIAIFPQTASVFVEAGYSAPPPAQVAPGQVLALFYRAVPLAEDGNPRSGRAEPPLPTLVAGLSAQVRQGDSLWNVPIIEVHQLDTCDSGLFGPACVLTSIRVQIPFEVDAGIVRDNQTGSAALPPVAQLVLYAEGRAVATSSLQPVPDNAHVLTTCDASQQTSASGSCDRLVFHRDGATVNADSPASKGEMVSIRLYGLGQTSPAATTGASAQPGYVLTDILGSPRVKASLTPFVNAIASAPRRGHSPGLDETPATVTAGGLEGGRAGVYELYIALPESLTPAVSCGDGARSNYLLNVITSQGVELVPLCIGR